MRKDIRMPKVEGVEVAIVNEEELGMDNWKVYILNKNDIPIDNVLVSSKGYGTVDGEKKKTSILRHLIGKVEANDFALIEPIDKQVFQLSNEYWVSYYINRQIYDKKFVFVAGSIKKENLTDIRMMGRKGILHT